ncbi:hypothetical protein A7K73_02280 [Candidatus Methylacidiphilum fumarolicum]|nr:hypothetical protein A7K73_02280 [Candidatus Methylacidiphilum fumarolicum]TFE77608.1 hypothetical protein A7D33_04350 [Candidatus Methylacidiphilum fumarolicum]
MSDKQEKTHFGMLSQSWTLEGGDHVGKRQSAEGSLLLRKQVASCTYSRGERVGNANPTPSPAKAGWGVIPRMGSGSRHLSIPLWIFVDQDSIGERRCGNRGGSCRRAIPPWRERRGFPRNWMKIFLGITKYVLILLPFVSFYAAKASTEYFPIDPPEMKKGSGGRVIRIKNVDVWLSGNPAMRYWIKGVLQDERTTDDWTKVKKEKWEAIKKAVDKARDKHADGVIRVYSKVLTEKRRETYYDSMGGGFGYGMFGYPFGFGDPFWGPMMYPGFGMGYGGPVESSSQIITIYHIRSKFDIIHYNTY